MSGRGRFPRRFRLPWRKSEQIEAEVDEEIAFHLDMRTEELVGRGMDPQSARVQARQEFGAVDEARDALSEADGAIEERTRRIEGLKGFTSDLRFAFRSIRRGRSATLSAILALGAGIGAATAVFGLVNWIALRPVPGITSPERLVVVEMLNQEGPNQTGLSYLNLVDLGAAVPALQAFAGYGGVGAYLAIDEAPAVAILGEAVAGDYFGTLGVRPFRGRLLSPEEEASAEPAHLAVISHRLWQGHFWSDPEVAGRRVRINGVEFTVVGVAPEGFAGTQRLGRTDVWVPASSYGSIRGTNRPVLQDRSDRIFMSVVGRLAPGATPELAQAQLRSAMSHLVEVYPEANEVHATFLPAVYHGIGVHPRAREQVTGTLLLMGGVAAAVLLIAWANVGNLLLLSGVRRRGELAVRRALGASTVRLLRTHLAEGMLLSMAGATVGVILALLLSRLFIGRVIGNLPEVHQIGLDWRVFGFVLVLTLLSGALCSVIPVVATHRDGLLESLKEATRSSTRRVSWLRGGLIVAQVSSALVLLVTALFLARTVHALNNVELGFDAEGVYIFDVDPSSLGYDADRARIFRDELHARLAVSPVLESIAVASGSPFSDASMIFVLRPVDASASPGVRAAEFSVTPAFFDLLRIPLLAGHGLAEASGENEVVISLSLARELFGDANPLGRQIAGPFSMTFTVVGIVGDARTADLRAPEGDPVIYRSIAKILPWQTSTTVLARARSRADAEAVVRDAVVALEPSLAIWHAESLSDAVANTFREERTLARLALVLAALAGLLAAVGLYAVVSYSVTQRTREIGIRMALGARFAAIMRLVCRETAPLLAGGTVLGILIALLGSRLLESRLFGVGRLDPLVYSAAAGLFAIAAAVALWGPVRAAGRVDPTEALRNE